MRLDRPVLAAGGLNVVFSPQSPLHRSSSPAAASLGDAALSTRTAPARARAHRWELCPRKQIQSFCTMNAQLDRPGRATFK